MAAYTSEPQPGPSSGMRNAHPSNSRSSEPDFISILENVIPGISDILEANTLRLVGQREWEKHQNCSSPSRFEEERKQLQDEVKKLKAELAKNKGGTVQGKNKKIENLQNKFADFQKEVKSKDKEHQLLIKELKKKLEDAEGREKKIQTDTAKQFEKKVQKANEKCDEVKGQLEQAKETVKTLESQLKEAMGRISDKNGTDERFQKEKLELETKLKDERFRSRNEIIALKDEKERMVQEKCRFLVFLRELTEKTNFPEAIDNEFVTSAILGKMSGHIQNLVENGGAKYKTELERQNEIIGQMDNLWRQLRSTTPADSTPWSAINPSTSTSPMTTTLATPQSNTTTPPRSYYAAAASSLQPEPQTIEAVNMDTTASGPTPTAMSFPHSAFPEYSTATTPVTLSTSIQLEPQPTSDNNEIMETMSTSLSTSHSSTPAHQPPVSAVDEAPPIPSHPEETPIIKEEPLSPSPALIPELVTMTTPSSVSGIADTTISIKLEEIEESLPETSEYPETSPSTAAFGSVVETPPVSPDETTGPARKRIKTEDTSSISSHQSTSLSNRQVSLGPIPILRLSVTAAPLVSFQGKIKIEPKTEPKSENAEEVDQSEQMPAIISTSSIAPVPPPAKSPPDAQTKLKPGNEKKSSFRTRQFTPFANPEIPHAVDTTDSSELFRCICGSSYMYDQGLKAHIRRETTEWKHKCDKCNQYFFYPCELNNHRANPSNCKNDENEVTTTAGNPLVSGGEDDFFDLDEFLSQPIENETPQVNHTAVPMNQSTETTADTMQESQHEGSNSHAPWYDNPDAKPGYFYCKCNKKFATKPTLTFHVDYWTKEWQFTCEICQLKFFSLGYLKKHLSGYHQLTDPLKEYSVGCQICGEMFQKRAQFYLHRKTKHNIHPTARSSNINSNKSIPPAPSEGIEPQPGTSRSYLPCPDTENQNMEIDSTAGVSDDE